MDAAQRSDDTDDEDCGQADDQPAAADDWVDDFQVTQDPNADDEGNDGNCKKLVVDEETDQFGPYPLDHQCAPAIADFE